MHDDLNTDAPVLLHVGDPRHDERTLLACALHGGADVARELLRTVKAWMFHDRRLGRTWAALEAVLHAGDPGQLPDPVADELVRTGEDADTTRHDLVELSKEVPSAANAPYQAVTRFPHASHNFRGAGRLTIRERLQESPIARSQCGAVITHAASGSGTGQSLIVTATTAAAPFAHLVTMPASIPAPLSRRQTPAPCGPSSFPGSHPPIFA